ncbi:MAG: glycosyltransferase family 87 protein [Candidatus Daviesbacteria bacterium]|nr:glycosyltransferase family 87 protein [Candidatus Daviesbacteria bacterium]
MKIDKKKIKNIKNILIYFFIICSFIYSIFAITKILVSFNLIDFSYYYQASKFILQNISPYYNGKFVLNYPPSSFFFFIPFSIFPYRLEEILWTILSYFSLLVSIFLLLKLFYKKISLKIYLVIYGLVMLSFPFKFNFGMGQVNIFILLFLCLNLYFYKTKKYLMSGIFLAIAISIKLTPIILLLFFLKKKRYDVIFSTLIFLLFLNILSILFFGINNFLDFYFKVLPSIPKIAGTVYYNQALTGFLSRLGLSFNIYIINYLIFIFLIMIGLIITKSKKENFTKEILEYGFFISLMLISGGLAWQHHFVLLLIPYLGFFILFLQKKLSRTEILLLFISYILVSYNIKSPSNFSGLLNLFLSHVFYGNLILLFLLVKRISFSKD